MINFILPGMWEHYKINIPLIGLFRVHPEYFNDNINISAVYGNFSFCTWDGGRIFPPTTHASLEDMTILQQIYNDILKVPIRFIYTSSLVTPDMYTDRFNNLALSICDKPHNEVVINDKKLGEYIKKTYQNYSFISSTTKCLTNPDDLMAELNDPFYKMVCWDYNLNKRKDVLESIPEELRPKCEFLINAICQPGCVYRKHHYYLNSVHAASYGIPYNMVGCSIEGNNLIPFGYKNNFTFDEIVEYEHNGFENFKLEGRSLSPLEVILNFVKYLVKPEWQWAVILYLENANRTLDLANGFDFSYCTLY